MILILGIAAGLLAGLVRSWIAGKPYRVPELTGVWLVLAAVLPQILVFQFPLTAEWFSSTWAAVVLVASQLVLLLFIWLNRDKVGILILGVGLLMNLVVILLNRGLMPVSPETVLAVSPEIPISSLQIGTRLGSSKNILLPVGDTRLAWLSDSILMPEWFPRAWVLSLGDLFIVLGVFWLLAVEQADQSSKQEKVP